jgi:TolB-like protein/DNA-binding winged helix-turn-helix (wHTH) protein/Tfp pilus assembly protein PilF
MEVRAPGERVRFDGFELDMRAGELHRNGRRVRLQDHPFQVLVLLLEHPSEVVTREELHRKLWPADAFVDFDAGLNTAVRKLREALGDSTDKPRFVETLPRRGYRFLAAAEKVTDQDASAPGADKPVTDSPFGDAPLVRSQEPPVTQTRPSGLRPAVGALGTLATLAIVLVVGVRWLRVVPRAQPPHIQSLAVLPLENLSQDPDQEYFADGMTDELITSLAKIRALRVISRSSVIPFKRTQKPLGEIARALKVDAVVEGTVRRSANRVRISAQLVQAASDTHVWAETYEGDLSNVLVLQSTVARDIARQIKVTLTPQEEARLARSRLLNPEAHEAYLKGGFFCSKRTEEGIQKGIQYLEKAIRIDPTYAPAYAALANCHTDANRAHLRRPDEAYAEAKAAAVKALELDDEIAEAHAMLGVVRLYSDRDWSAAEKEFKRAIDLEPEDGTVHQRYALGLAAMSRLNDALAEIRRGRDVDPLMVILNANVGQILYYGRQYQRAMEEFKKALEMEPTMVAALQGLGHTYVQMGRYAEAIAEFQKARLDGGSLVAAQLGHAYAESGKRGEAIRILNELKDLSRQKYIPPFDIALIYIGLGEKDQAFEWLQKSDAERSRDMAFLEVDPVFDPLRSDPRFADLLHHVGLSSHGADESENTARRK